MEQWVEIAGKNGLSTLVVLAIGFFIYKKIWPIFEKRLAEAETERKENLQRWENQGKQFTDALRQEREDNARRFEDQGKIFMEALRTQNVLTAETHRESMKAQGKIADELRRVHEYLRNGNGK